MKLLAISGSARRESTNTAFLTAMKEFLPTGVELSVFARLDTLPVFSPDTEGADVPLPIAEFLERVSTADGIIISSPEYARALPGGLKNAIDWLVSRFEVIGKPIAIAHASHRGDDMLASLRLVLSTISTGFLESAFVRIPLIGKSPVEITTLLRSPHYESEVSAFLANFAASIQLMQERSKFTEGSTNSPAP